MAVWSSVAWSDLTDDRRIDAEYYRPECLAQARAIGRWPHQRLDELASVSDGNHVSIAEQFAETGVRYLRGQDLSEFFVSDADPAYIPESTYRALKRSHMRSGDVLLGVVATIGTVSLVTDRFGKLTGNCKIAIVRPKAIESEYLAVFFSSLIGQRELRRRARGTVQTGVILPDLKSIPVPVLPDRIRLAVVSKVQEARQRRADADTCYSAAEKLLESALGLNTLDLSPRLHYERRFADTRAAGRLDAEYFNPRMQNLIGALARDGTSIADVAKLATRRFRPCTGIDFRYIEIGDIAGCDTPASTVIAGEDAPSRATWIVKAGDVITTTVRPIRRLSAIIGDDQDGYVCSSGFAVLKPTRLEPELLLTYLRLPLVCELLDLHTTASMYPAISTTDLMRTPISLPDAATRRRIVAKVQDSFTARREAHRLLSEAKAVVERQILGEKAVT